MNTILDHESPQLTVLNGDLITGENTHLHNSTKYLDQLLAPLVSRRIPWASTYGNHDQQFNLSTAEMLAVESKYGALSYTRGMVRVPRAGTSNYYVPVFGARSGDTPALILWFFDSRGGSYYQQLNSTGGHVVSPGVVHPAVHPLSPLTLLPPIFPSPKLTNQSPPARRRSAGSAARARR
jgi:hypothetical protein